MGVDLKYDIDTMLSVKRNIKELRDSIEKTSGDIQKEFNDLRDKWDTTASKNFYDVFDNDWIPGIQKTSAVLSDLEEALQSAADEYDLIADEAKRRFSS